MKRLIVTGANGFIGRHCLPLLLEKEYEVHAVVPADGMQLDYHNVQWHIVDLLDFVQVRKFIETISPTHLLHLAWYTEPGKYWTSVENFRWLQSSLEILRAFKENGGQRILMAGTCAEYDWSYGYCSEGITPLNPSTLYGTCKKSLYDVLMSFAQKEDISAAWGRVFFLYGYHENPSRLIPSAINTLLDHKEFACTQGDQIRDFLHVVDVASAFVTLLSSNIEGAVNIASGKPVTLKDILLKIGEKLDLVNLIQFGALPTPQTEPPLLVANINRLQKELGWTPSYDLNSGLDKTIEWWKRQRVAS